MDYSTGSEHQTKPHKPVALNSDSKIPRVTPTARRVEKLNYRVDDMLSLLR